VQTPLRFEALFPLLQVMQIRRAEIIESFAVGDRAIGQIVDGPFKGFEARLDQLDIQRSEVRVKIWVFDRETPVVLKLHQIELLEK
jgi:transcription antitermination factor NusG